MTRIYFPNLNGLRFIAALSVMIYHFFGITVLNGHFGVILFFVLSGFLITYLLLEEKQHFQTISIRKFYLRRILRIWPLYFFILLIASLLFFQADGTQSDYWKALPYYVFFVPNLAFVLDIGIKYASILWSVGAEEQFYLTWPWIVRKIRTKRVIYWFLMVILIWTFTPHVIDYVNSHFCSNNQFLQVISNVLGRMGFAALATGATIAYLAKYHLEKLKFLFHNAVQVVVVLTILVIWIFHLFPQMAIVDEIYSILFAILIANLALNPKTLICLEYKVLNYLGKISFGLYVYHLLAFDSLHYFWKDWDFQLSREIEFLIGLMVSILFASLSYYILEKPFLKIKSRMSNKA